MLIFAVEDEPKMLRALHHAIAEAEPEAVIRDFAKASEVIRAIGEGARPEVIFSDVEMPGMDGLELALRVKEGSPESRIIFVTAFPKYAAQAYRLHINGYIVKPVETERVREELQLLRQPPVSQKFREDKLEVRCFGYFEVFWQGKPLIFQRTQTKELLAYLIDRKGAACTSDEIITAFWENGRDEKSAKGHIRVLINDLKTTLKSIRLEDLLIRERRQIGIRRDLVDCDYYRMLDGDITAVNAFRGEYMKQYSWAELTVANLHFTPDHR